MLKQVSYRGKIYKWLIIFAELVAINIFYGVFLHLCGIPEKKACVVVLNVSYILATAFLPPVVQSRIVRSEQIAGRVVGVTVFMFVAYLALFSLLEFRQPPLGFSLCAFLVILLMILIIRVFFRAVLRRVRAGGRDNVSVVFVGGGLNQLTLYTRLTDDLSTGYRIFGYFEEAPFKDFENIPLLGDISSVTKWIEEHHVDMLFCNLPSARAEQILEIIRCCENNMVRFYSVPNVRNYVRGGMDVEIFDDVPVLSLHREPMQQPLARIAKRCFDIVCSFLFLICIFWWVAIIVAIISKITMPGPVFFCQKRTGLKGKTFTCIKFRSMRVNEDADKLQATENDPRKTKWGDIMRRTNIDELPQFINVLIGDMSIVGPRPHMVLHTEKYSQLIEEYMVRHFAKPGITGWAQVNGCRGETRELWQMRERVEKDVWYMENWTFLLDIRIIFITLFNALGHEKGNAY